MRRSCTTAYHDTIRLDRVAWDVECEGHCIWYDAGLELANCRFCGTTIGRELPGPWLPGDYWTRHEREHVQALWATTPH